MKLYRKLMVAALVAIALGPREANAQPKPAPSAVASAAVEEEVSPDSPRAMVARFYELCAAGEYAEAARSIDLDEAQRANSALAARRLKAVLDRSLRLKLADISPKAQGNDRDGLSHDLEEIGVVRGPHKADPVRLVKRRTAEGARWIFARSTADKIDAWYIALDDRWQEEVLPERLLRPGPRGVLLWQWVALPILFLLGLGAGMVLGRITRAIVRRIVARTETTWDDALVDKLGPPLTLTWAVAAVHVGYPFLSLAVDATAFLGRMIRAGYFIAVLWLLFRMVDVAASRLLDLPNAKDAPAARSLVPLGARVTKVALFVIAVTVLVAELGYSPASLVAGLGVGGVALALAAQKTVENLFGSLSIGVDQPFRVGDFIVVDGLTTGVVESIGLRSTRIRTLERTLVTLPNGKLADMRVESFSERDKYRVMAVLPLARATSTARARALIAAIRAHIEAIPKVTDETTVALTRIGDSSLDVEIMAWFALDSFKELAPLREEVLFALLEIAEREGVSLAYPTRSVELQGKAAGPVTNPS